MSDRMTEVSGPAGGFMSHGRKTRAEMIDAYRSHYARERAIAERALAVPDSDLRVSTFLGIWVRRNEQEVTQ